ncbi:hypothetical protein ACLEPN_24565 [Myxococcus sp. 1LA]
MSGIPYPPPLAPITRRYLEARFGGRSLQQGEAARLLTDLKRAVLTESQRVANKGTRPPQARAS